MPDQSLEDYKAAQAAEYGTWVAAVPIDVDGVRAFNEGNPVPASHVKKYGYDKSDLVKKAEAAAKAASSAAPEKG